MTIPVNIEGVGRVNFPDGFTPEQIKFAIENDILPRVRAQAATKQPDAIDAGALKAMKPTRLERFGRGFADVTQGVKQGYLSVKDMISGGAESDTYTAEKTDELQRYERGRGPDAGIDWMRMGGNVAATAPAMLIPGAQSTLPVRMMAGAAGGGAASGAMFTPEGESKIGQIAVGAALGAAAPAAVHAAKQGMRSVGNFMRGAPPPVPVQQLEQQIILRLEQQGLDYNKLTQTVKESLLADAQKAISTGGTLDDAMLANKATIESIGAKPTRASVTRNPKDWQTEKNLRGITGVGEQIAERDQTNAKAMVDYLGKLREGTGGKTSTAYEAGESAITAIQVQDKAKERAVGELYNAFRDSGLKEAQVPEARLTEALAKIIDEVGLDNVPAAVQKRLKDFGFIGGERTRYLTVQEADLFNRLLNANNPGQGPASKTIGMLKGALNESLIETPGGGELLTKAREAAAQRFAEQRAGKGITAALDDVSPDRFVQKFVIGADVKDLRAMMSELGKSSQGKQAIQDVKGHIFDTLMLKATGATNIDDVAGKPFSGVKFSKALDSISPEKLHQLFTPKEMEALRTLQKASKLLTEDVPFSDVNYSKTSAALANLIFRIGSTPMLGKVVLPIIGTGKTGADWLHSESARRQVAQALVAGVGQPAKRATLPVSKVERMLPAAAASIANQPGNDE